MGGGWGLYTTSLRWCGLVVIVDSGESLIELLIVPISHNCCPSKPHVSGPLLRSDAGGPPNLPFVLGIK